MVRDPVIGVNLQVRGAHELLAEDFDAVIFLEEER